MVVKCKCESLVLIDGYNLYHSLREIEKDLGHKVRWLDIRKLAEMVLNRIFPPSCPFPHVLFFTAYSHHNGAEHVARQKDYHRCIKRKNVTVVTDGDWAKKDVSLVHHFSAVARQIPAEISHLTEMASTNVEKGTDVSLAAHLMHLGPQAKWVCVISGDMDLLPAINLFKEVNPEVKFALARPYKRVNKKMNMDNTTDITVSDCLKCLLPKTARTKNGADVSKPAHW